MMQRRKFIRESSLIGAGSLALGSGLIHASPLIKNPLPKSDKLRFGVIGCNGMGWSDTRSLLKMDDVELVAICDVDQNVVQKRKEEYATLRDNKVKTYGDYRELLDDKKVDFVVIGTPDHWHCKIMVDAVQAGKDVYCEKPLANSIQECNIMMQAAEKTGKIVQIGQWQRSGTHYKKAKEILDSGNLGKIRLVKVWAYQGWMKPVNVIPDGAVPEGVDYDFWLGPAPKRPFNQNRFHFNFRWFWDYAGGLMTDWGVHEIDIALYFMGATAPKSVMASGGKLAYPDDASETPDTLQTVFEYDDFIMLWEHATGIDNGPYGRGEGIAFIGNNGTLVVNRQGLEVIIERDQGKRLMEPVEAVRPDGNYLDFHTKNFVDAIKANDPSMLSTHINSGAIAAINAHMGNVAYRTQSKVYWDAEQGRFKDNDQANAMINASYQNGWELPEV
ncbi:MAG: Gfo/Idh/MocA family oxidoreductase [Cyclobacteriaceae bacterium]